MRLKERDIEDFICQNPESISDGLDVRIIGNQVRLPHGRLDILAVIGDNVAAIELKSRPLRANDLVQVLRYTFDLRKWAHDKGSDPQAVTPVLVGLGAEYDLLLAASAINMQVFEAVPTSRGFIFEALLYEDEMICWEQQR